MAVALPVQDERGDPDAGEDAREVGVHEHRVDGRSRGGTGPEALAAHHPAAKGGLVRAARREVVDQRSTARRLAVELDIALGEFLRHAERRLGSAQEAGKGVDENETADPVRLGGREQHHRQRRLRGAEESRLLAVGRLLVPGHRPQPGDDPPGHPQGVATQGRPAPKAQPRPDR